MGAGTIMTKPKVDKSMLYCVFIFLVLVLRILSSLSKGPAYPDGTKIRITSRITKEPVRYENSQRVVLEKYSFYLPLYPQVSYGDTITVSGVVEGWKLKSPKLEETDYSKALLYSYRQRIIEFYQQNLPGDHAALVAGMTLGSKSDIGNDFWSLLKNSGTAHVVVASGMNVTLIAGFLIGSLVIFVNRKKAIVLTFIGIWTYALISGFDAPIIRAAIMGTFSFLAQKLGKVYYAIRTLLITVAVMLLIKPEWVFDVGFLLSFAATASIIIFYPRTEQIFKFMPKIVREDWTTTLSAQIGVTPILIFAFGKFNPFSPIINVLVLWTVVPITIVGLIAGFVGTLLEPLGRLILLLTYPLTSWFIFIVQKFG